MNRYEERYDTDQPWIIYTYGRTHDDWWPFWSSTRVLGYALIGCDCCICGERRVLKVKMPRFGPIVDTGKHEKRQSFLAEHAHPDRATNPLTWAQPLRNLAGLSADRRPPTDRERGNGGQDD